MKAIRLMTAAALTALLATAAGCSDDNDGVSPGDSIFQQYEVTVFPEGNKAAFANFRLGSATGERVELTDGSWLMINAMTCYYQEPTSPTVPEFNYSMVIPANHEEAIFTFRRSKDVELVNSVKLGGERFVTLPEDIKTVANGERIPLGLGDIEPGTVEVKLYDVSHQTLGIIDSYPATVFADFCVFDNVPAGTYTLAADVVTVAPTTQNDGTAGGTITKRARVTRQDIKVN